MNRIHQLKHIFVEFIPETLEDGVLYVSIPYNTASHRCFCGCGNKVVTPITPAAWSMTYDGRSVSLDPSVGNSEFPCKSHYVITRSKVRWAPPMTNRLTNVSRAREQRRRDAYYGRASEVVPEIPVAMPEPKALTWWEKMKAWFG